MSNEQYLALLKQAREATASYRETPAYKQEVEAKRKLSEKRNELISKFIEFGKKLGLSESETATICSGTYNTIRKGKE
jgi:DNA-binding transcriptional regulator YhcF (GntR family)